MKINKTGWIIGGIALCALLVFGVLWLSPFSTEALTEEELKATALTKYPGEIIRTAKSDNYYEIEVQMENGIYAIRMDNNNGNILSLEQLANDDMPPLVDKLTEAQIKKEISTQGELQSIHFINDADTSYYKVIVHKENTEITLKVDPNNGDIIESTDAPLKVPEESTLLTEQQVLIIAAEHLKGVADDDVELYHPSGQTPYYLVEVEIEDGEDDREAVVQVDAYTGTVKSVNWED